MSQESEYFPHASEHCCCHWNSFHKLCTAEPWVHFQVTFGCKDRSLALHLHHNKILLRYLNSSMHLWKVMIKGISGTESFSAKFALVWQSSWKVNILNMFSQVASICSLLPTNSALVHFWSTCWILDNVLIEHCDTHIACNHMVHQIRTLHHSLVAVLSQGC